METPYWLPHSVTIWCATVDGDLYIGARDPDTKNWPPWAEESDEVRLKIGERVYPARLVRVEDEALLGRVRDAYLRKYELGDGGAMRNVRYWSVLPVPAASAASGEAKRRSPARRLPARARGGVRVRDPRGEGGRGLRRAADVVDTGPRLVLCRHEQNAAFMAGAIGRLTGRPGVSS